MTIILLTGRTGQVGWELQRALAPLGEVIATDRGQLDLADHGSIRTAIRQAKPAIIVNAAAFTSVDDVEQQPELALRVNGVAPGIIADEAKRLGALLVHYSTSYVFDGTARRPYVEDDPPNPINAYGRTKLAGERAVAAAGGHHLILRTSWIYSQRGTNFLLAFLRLARQKTELPVVNDQIGNPTWARAIAEATATLLGAKSVRDHAGLYHLSAGGSVSRLAFAERILALARERRLLDAARTTLKSVATAQYPLPAARPLNCTTSKERIRRVFGLEMTDWERQLRLCLDELPAGSES